MSEEMKDAKEVKEFKSKAKHKFIGKLFTSKNYGNFIVVEYLCANDVTVEFVDTGSIVKTSTPAILRGEIKDRFKPTVFGVGYIGDSVTKVNGKITPEYKLWCLMLNRCYGKTNRNNLSAYENCTVSENFKNFTYFKDWCNKQVGFNEPLFQLDKDLLMRGNRIYSENTCCFIPQEINVAISVKKDKANSLPVGFSNYTTQGKFRVELSKRNVSVYLGVYDTIEEGMYVYKQAKEAYIKELANKWKDKLSHTAYNALMLYTIE